MAQKHMNPTDPNPQPCSKQRHHENILDPGVLFV
jgi:hypothetical protein